MFLLLITRKPYSRFPTTKLQNISQTAKLFEYFPAFLPKNLNNQSLKQTNPNNPNPKNERPPCLYLLAFLSYINILSLFAVSCAKGSKEPSLTKSTFWLSSCSNWQIMSAYLKRLIFASWSKATRMSISLPSHSYENKSRTTTLYLSAEWRNTSWLTVLFCLVQPCS